MHSRLSAILLLVCTAAAAQEIQPIPSAQNEYDSIRSYYIENFPDYFFVYPVLKQRTLSFELEQDGNADALVTYKPNNTYSFGIGMYLFELGVELAVAIPLEERSIALYGESDARDLQLNVLGKKWGLDAFYQKYRGFYLNDVTTEDLPADEPYPQRSDIDTRNVGITGHYVFNNQKFSFRSAYNFAERQVFSKGSLLLFSSLSAFRLEADSSIVSQAQRVFFEGDVRFREIRYTSFSIAPGYTYSIVYNGFFLNGTLSVGPAHHWITYRRDTERERKETAINSFVAARIGLGYNGQRIFGGISFLTQGNNVRFEDVRFSHNNASFKILVGYRFREWGVLKRRVWDLVPFDI